MFVATAVGFGMLLIDLFIGERNDKKKRKED